jgi:hypothetical protein
MHDNRTIALGPAEGYQLIQAAPTVEDYVELRTDPGWHLCTTRFTDTAPDSIGMALQLP